MSSAISTNAPRTPNPEPRTPSSEAGLQPWQFFALAALGCATAVTFIARGQGPTAVILLGVLMGAAALVGYATLRAVRPLVSPEDDRTVMIGERTRVALEREKLLVLRSIKELEFDRAMKRLSEEDFAEMAGRLRARAAGLMRQLDAGAGYREQIEKDLAKRLDASADDARLPPSREARSGEPGKGSRSSEAGPRVGESNSDADESGSRVNEPSIRSASLSGERVCASCETQNDPDARFCKQCGAALAGK